ncbi:TPA: tape measure protein [Pasteurella multocida]|uniref:tape measure protein n=1 Tax=Pasteurella multocida TaxID=747 RepID=UPI0029B6602F|nr:tape measure protein [Pasteurella multocida]HEH9669019.1 tape measure protein [Pasteurella multocida]HEH9696374.1 tape measure protein [Pasteurella multocida]HEH9727321.1 tape measure protein [Pasteurella multocida]HEH9752610.1 tape measure protein [Pasteurella multocida]
MSKYSTSFYINLAGNLPSQARRFSGVISSMATRSTKALNGMKAATASAMSQLTSFKGLAMGALAGAGMSMGAGSFIRAAAEAEMAAIRMKQTFGEQGEAANAFLKQFATQTTLQFGETQDAMMRLKTAGIDPMNGSLQALVDMNAKVGGDSANLEGYIHALTKGYMKDKLTMEEINPLFERKVKVFELLSKATGGKYTAEQMQEMASKGRLGRKAIEALLRQMGEDAKGAAKEQMKTWDGLVSNLGDTFTSMQQTIMDKGLFDELKNELQGLLDWLNQKIESGEFDEFAKGISDNLVEAIRALKSGAEELKPILDSVGQAVKWAAEQTDGYGNLAKVMLAVYGANKLLNATTGSGIMGNAWGLGKWGYQKLGRKNNPIANAAGQMAGAVGGVQPVYVTNFGEMGFDLGGGRRKKGGKKKLPNKQGGKPKGLPPKPTKTSTPPISNQAKQTAQAVKNATKQTAVLAETAKATSQATKAVSKVAVTAAKGASKAVPLIGTATSLAMSASTLLDENASEEEKGEAVGSVAGATVGAIIGQALIPIPVAGAAIGGFIGDWLGGWLGGEVAKGLSDATPPKTEMNGKVDLTVNLPAGVSATVQRNEISSSNKNDDLSMAVKTGNTSVGMRGGN